MTRSVDVLILSYSAYGRDFEAFMLLKYHLEHEFNLNVRIESVRHLYWIDRIKPPVLVLTDTINPSNIIAAKYAVERGVFVATIQGEGIYNPTYGEDSLWGWNHGKEVIESLRLEWSERNRNFLIKYCPTYELRTVITGAGRFDRYRIYRFKDRSEFLEQYGKPDYQHVVAYAGYAFAVTNPKRRQNHLFLKHFTEDQLELVKQDRDQLKCWLNQIVQDFPKVLFIFKLHPGDDKATTELVLDRSYPNVIFLQNEEKIEDLINVSDLWLHYNSGSALEAWLLEKPTCAFVPNDTSFQRKGYEKGGIQLQTYDDLTEMLSNFINTSTLEGYEELLPFRQQIIKTYIGWDDGFNSLRAARTVAELFKSQSFASLKAASIGQRLQHIKIHLVRNWLSRRGKLPKYDGFHKGVIKKTMNVYYPQITSFVEKHSTQYHQVLNEKLVGAEPFLPS